MIDGLVNNLVAKIKIPSLLLAGRVKVSLRDAARLCTAAGNENRGGFRMVTLLLRVKSLYRVCTCTSGYGAWRIYLGRNGAWCTAGNT